MGKENDWELEDNFSMWVCLKMRGLPVKCHENSTIAPAGFLTSGIEAADH
jgi:hypothetical protein